jgi:hypothetical protein
MYNIGQRSQWKLLFVEKPLSFTINSRYASER